MTFRKLRFIPVYFMFLMTFGLNAVEKWAAGGIPDWFRKQFEGTVLNLFPGSLGLSFILIAALESLICVGLLASLARGEFLPGKSRGLLLGSLLLAAFTFGVLGFGLRLTHDYNGAANLFFYFGATLVSILFVERA